MQHLDSLVNASTPSFITKYLAFFLMALFLLAPAQHHQDAHCLDLIDNLIKQFDLVDNLRNFLTQATGAMDHIS